MVFCHRTVIEVFTDQDDHENDGQDRIQIERNGS